MNNNVWYIIVLVVAVLGLVIYSIIKLIQNNWIGKLTSTLKQSIKEAEESHKSGAEKKKYVMEKIEEQCKEFKIPFKLIINLVSKLINQIITYYNYISK